MPSIEARSVLSTNAEISRVERDLAEVRARLQSPTDAELHAWEEAERKRIAQRGAGLRLHPLQARGVTTPNSGYTGEVLTDGSVRIEQPGGLAALQCPP